MLQRERGVFYFLTFYENKKKKENAIRGAEEAARTVYRKRQARSGTSDESKKKRVREVG